ncbi:MAG: MgtC/SapB family protein [Spirochaetales bacterium]|nr:MgtC/SapB family protein [Spirochaetales bacterium]
MCFGVLAGALIGIERERSSNPAGLRTHILIASASTALMLLSIYLPAHSLSDGDSGRIAAQVVSGIGFLGAGAIMRFGTNVQGLTTAASIWSVAALGLVIGGGMYFGGLLLLTVMLFTLYVLDKLEKRSFRQYALKVLRLWLDSGDVRIRDIIHALKEFKVLVKSIDFSQELENDATQLKFYLKMPNDVDLEKMVARLSEMEHVKKIKMDQNY